MITDQFPMLIVESQTSIQNNLWSFQYYILIINLHNIMSNKYDNHQQQVDSLIFLDKSSFLPFLALVLLKLWSNLVKLSSKLLPLLKLCMLIGYYW